MQVASEMIQVPEVNRTSRSGNKCKMGMKNRHAAQAGLGVVCVRPGAPATQPGEGSKLHAWTLDSLGRWYNKVGLM